MKRVPAKLLKTAAQAAKLAYCPYSKLRVGAALLAENGEVFTGCNVENSSYGLTICAERAAFFAAVASGRRKFKAMAVVASGAGIPRPCGACRQVMREFCGEDFAVYCAAAGNLRKFEETRLGELLPKAFVL